MPALRLLSEASHVFIGSGTSQQEQARPTHSQPMIHTESIERIAFLKSTPTHTQRPQPATRSGARSLP
jgi:hypothetical protein